MTYIERDVAYEVWRLECWRDHLKDLIDKGPIVVSNNVRLELEETLGKLYVARDRLNEIQQGTAL